MFVAKGTETLCTIRIIKNDLQGYHAVALMTLVSSGVIVLLLSSVVIAQFSTKSLRIWFSRVDFYKCHHPLSALNDIFISQIEGPVGGMRKCKWNQIAVGSLMRLNDNVHTHTAVCPTRKSHFICFSARWWHLQQGVMSRNPRDCRKLSLQDKEVIRHIPASYFRVINQ